MVMGHPSSVIAFHTYVIGVVVFNLAVTVISDRGYSSSGKVNLLHSRVEQHRPDIYLDTMLKAGPPTATDSMQYLTRTLSKFKAFAKENRAQVEAGHKAEEERLQASLEEAVDKGTRLALLQSVTSNAQALDETRRVYSNIVNFASSIDELLKQTAPLGSGCERTQCGLHAFCTDTMEGPNCVCNEGYVGTGMDCAAPPHFKPQHLLFESSSFAQTQARDLNVAIFGKNSIAVVFTDMSRSGIGRTVVGNVLPSGMVTMAPPEAFTMAGNQALSPVVVGTEGHRILVTWRDQNINGHCWMRGAALGTTSVKGAEQHLQWGEPVNFCKSQSQKMAALPLPGNRVVVLYTDQMKATQHTPAGSFGNSVLLEVGNKGALTSMGRFRFAEYAVCRLEVTRLTPKTFVIAARAAPAIDEMDSSVHANQEALALFGEMSGDDLVYDPNPVNLEPQSKNIWARGVSLIAPNTFAYAYQRGTDLKTMLAVVHVNDTTHRMEVVHRPSQIKDGFSPYISMLSVPYTASDPHTLTYYEGAENSMVNICSWDPVSSKLRQCEESTWLQGKVKSVAGVHLGGGKSLMVFTPESGTPYYSVFGLSKK